MFILVHTVTMSYIDYDILAQFYHTIAPSSTIYKARLRFKLLGKHVAVKLRNNVSNRRNRNKMQLRSLECYGLRSLIKRRCTNIRHRFRAVHINQSTNFMNNTLVSANSFVKGEDPSLGNNGNLPCSPVNLLQETKGQIVNIQSQLCQSSGLSSDANSDQTAAWLQAQRFGAHIGTFASFSGADILRLSRDDLVQICGLADGIRLYNALHAKTIAPKLTLYMCLEQSTVFNAMYLSSYTNSEFCSKLSTLIGISSTQVQDFFVQGPNGIHVLISDDVIRNFKDETMFVIEVMHDIGKYRVLLKPVNQR